MFSDLSAARTLHLMYNVYTNDSLHGVCLSTVFEYRLTDLRIMYYMRVLTYLVLSCDIVIFLTLEPTIDQNIILNLHVFPHETWIII